MIYVNFLGSASLSWLLIQLVCERIVPLMIKARRYVDTMLEYTQIKVFSYRDIADLSCNKNFTS